MADPGKLRRRERAAIVREWARAGEPAPELEPQPAPPEERDDAISGLLGTPPPSPSPWRRYRRPAAWGLVGVVLAGVVVATAIWVRYHSQHVTSKNAAVRGHVAELGTRLTGRVSKVVVDVGDRVVEGQVLVHMEDRHLLAEVQEARADVEGLERTIEIERLNIVHERRRIGQQGEEEDAKVAAAAAQADAAKIRADDARRNFEIQDSLFKRDGVVSSEAVRDAEIQWRTADARLAEARANSKAVRSAGRTARLAEDALPIQERKVGVLEAELLRAKARLTRAEADLDGATIRAPESGAIVRRIVQPGGSVEAGQPIIAMWLGSDVWVEAWVDEDDIGAVNLGSLAEVTFHSFPGREFAGVVDKIGLTTDLEVPDALVPKPRFSRIRSAPVVGVRIRLKETPPGLVPGLSAVVAIRRAE